MADSEVIIDPRMIHRGMLMIASLTHALDINQYELLVVSRLMVRIEEWGIDNATGQKEIDFPPPDAVRQWITEEIGLLKDSMRAKTQPG